MTTSGPETHLELSITGLSHAGEGVGRHLGRVVFVPFALPGELVRVAVVEDKKAYARARLVEVLTASPDRVAPPCPHFYSQHHAETGAPACGGCQLQHMAYPAQLAFKRQQVVDQLIRLGGWAEEEARQVVRPIIAAPAPLSYRNQVQFSLSPEGALGFQAAGSHQVVPITTCAIAAPGVKMLFPRLKLEGVPALERLTVRASDHESLIVLEAAGEAPEVEIDLPVSAALLRPDGATLTLAGRDYLVETVHGRDFKISAGSFFQVNTPVAEALVDEVVAALAPRAEETVLEVYCGVGLFTAFIAPRTQRVIGVEAFEPAVEDAAVNLDAFENVEIYCAPAEAVLPGLEAQVDAVLVDPPRAGCAPAVLEAIVARAPNRVVYVACDTATFARDARQLAQAGYRLTAVQPLDMFPQTHHVECVARFVAASA